MGVLNYKYRCLVCEQESVSYFHDMEECQLCGSKNIVKEEIKHLQIDKFSEEGQNLIKKLRKGRV